MILVDERKLVEKLREILSTADLTTMTTSIVRRNLEDHFGVHLSDKKAFIREQVDLFLREQVDVEEKNEEKEEGRSGEEAGVEEEEGEEDEELELEDEDGEGTSNGKGSGKKRSTKKGTVERKAGGFTKLCTLSPQLQKFIGEPELARTQVVKRMWAYIREHDLQDPKNKRKIVCDDKLFDILKVKVIDMFQMNKVLSKHIWPLGSHSAPCEKEIDKQSEEENKEGRKKSKEKSRKMVREDKVESSQDKKRQKSGKNPFTAHLKLSEALVKFIGTGESALSRADVVKKMWAYIKENNLQDPSDKRRILCDDKLKELLEVDSFNGFTVAKLLAPHFSKLEQQDDPASNSDESSNEDEGK